MLKVEALLLLFLAGNPQSGAEKLDRYCLGMCHSATLIAQQRLDRAGWTREVDKMIRWGASVPASDKEALIDYLAQAFHSSRPLPNTAKSLPEGKGADIARTACLGCHDDTSIVKERLDRAGWAREVEEMIRWGAYVPASRKDELIDYLFSNFSKR